MIEATATHQTSSAQGASHSPRRRGRGTSPNPLPRGAAPAAMDPPVVTSWSASAALGNLRAVYDQGLLEFGEYDALQVIIEKRAGLPVKLCDACSVRHATVNDPPGLYRCGQCVSEGR